MKDLPRGAVTFLFSEIDGSTRLVHEMRGGWDEVLAEHQRLLREAIQRHGGHEVGTEGAAVLVAFPSARGAVLAALEAQRALTRHPWPEGAAVEVRMGIHTGQAVPISGHYGGSALDRVARICAAGHGEQVLVSQTTQTLLEDEEEEDSEVALRDLSNRSAENLRGCPYVSLLSPRSAKKVFAIRR